MDHALPYPPVPSTSPPSVSSLTTNETTGYYPLPSTTARNHCFIVSTSFPVVPRSTKHFVVTGVVLEDTETTGKARSDKLCWSAAFPCPPSVHLLRDRSHYYASQRPPVLLQPFYLCGEMSAPTISCYFAGKVRSSSCASCSVVDVRRRRLKYALYVC